MEFAIIANADGPQFFRDVIALRQVRKARASIFKSREEQFGGFEGIITRDVNVDILNVPLCVLDEQHIKLHDRA